VTSPLFRLGLETGIEAAAGVGSQLKKDHDDNDEHSPDLARLSGGQVRQEEVLATAPAQCFHRVDDVLTTGTLFRRDRLAKVQRFYRIRAGESAQP
jgi:hypothetical protein